MVGPTTDHTEIRRWAQAQNATPAEMHTYVFDAEPVRLRFVFGELNELAKKDLRPISWEQFFAMFEIQGLALVYDQGPNYEILQIEKKRSPQRFDPAMN